MSIFSVDDYRLIAEGRLPAELWDHIEGGGGDEITLRANKDAFAEVLLRPRVLVDVSVIDTKTTVLGSTFKTPIGIAPTAYQKQIHADGELATVRAADAAGALFIASFFASTTLEDIAATGGGPKWLQLYWFKERAAVADVALRAKAAGYEALVVTVDAPRIGMRRRDQRNSFTIDPSVRAANIMPNLMERAHERQEGVSSIAAHAYEMFDQSITWTDLDWLRSVSGLPIVLKGVLTAEDAVLAVEHGVEGLIVSNHGGRQLDGVVPTIRALPEVVAAVNGRCPVLLDGGVRSGRDVLIALALGATAVLIGRPVLWALAADGKDGVRGLLNMLTEELEHTMALTGRPKLASIDRSVVTWSR